MAAAADLLRIVQRAAFLPLGMIRIGRDQHRHGAVAARDHHFGAGVGVAGVAFAVENRIRIVFLRLMIEDQDDFAARVDGRVIVVVRVRGR